MKTYKHLYEKIDKEAVLLAIREASRGGKKKKRRDAQEALKNPDAYADFILSELPHFKNDRHTPKEIYDGISRKKRTKCRKKINLLFSRLDRCCPISDG